MNLQEMKESEALFVLPKDVAEITGEDPQAIRVKARNGRLEYKCIINKSRVKILRKSFLEFLEEYE